MHHLYKEESVEGRYVTLNHLTKTWLPGLPEQYVDTIGKSENGQLIYSITLGTGEKKVLMWSQMHGNESTTTKAVLDLVNFLSSNSDISNEILKNCKLVILPMLNPDGAKAYTRVNANEVDLNRDAQNRSQAETNILWSVFESFQPNFCFNLHDQRTLFNVGGTDQVATVSFLSPASDSQRSITDSRVEAMKLIVGMNHRLQQEIPGQVGRYDDAFNANCIGDSFQMKKVPTVLFEAGHYPNDYEREETRRFIFFALIEALEIISENKLDNFEVSEYASIPENHKFFFDVLIKNASVVNPNIETGNSVGIRYEEILNANSIEFKPKVDEVGTLEDFYGHLELDLTVSEDFDSLSSQKEILELLIHL
ncbi:M14 family metallopeptidase [Flagellimonas meridianipacifica]|uniref:Zinc carboxypeptidase n=1 Tax=Flagellimonas meridianipacifica TaxID=1080225 RepID=A0A2T0MC38_9FLAO|nr:M14 metallopeptidase family protein [Allomuricauda pacifica]PRX55074.1 zinc carboxypeptidase [Allomuricauda pacifica]